MAEIKFGENLSSERRNIVSKKVLELLSYALDASVNPVATITSTIREPRVQAKAMYDNIKNGKLIGYKEPGQIVQQLCNQNIKKLPEEKVLDLMEAQIIALAMKGQLVSRHCVSEEQYRQTNIIDLSTKMPNPRDFVEELVKSDKVVKIITPFTRVYKDSRILIDIKEPAIHVEIKTT